MTEPTGTQRTYTPDFLQELFANPLDAGYADAADKRATSGPPGPVSRRIGFTLRMIILVAAGLLLAVAYLQTVAARPETHSVQKSLASDVTKRQKTTEALQRTASALTQQVNQLRDAQIGAEGAQALRDLEAQTGLAAVTGPGVVVTMSDGPAPVDPVTGKTSATNQGKVLDFDLQTIVNELWREGAEAISINGQRLTATSAIRAAGSAILVNFAPMAQPYRISAIGGPNLADRFNDSSVAKSYRGFASAYGMHFTSESSDSLSLPAAPDPQLQYATVVPSVEPSAGPSAGPAKSPSTPGTPSPSPSGGH
jgi:uncharacterized protein YlxW (UPF0749 family)